MKPAVVLPRPVGERKRALLDRIDMREGNEFVRPERDAEIDGDLGVELDVGAVVEGVDVDQ